LIYLGQGLILLGLLITVFGVYAVLKLNTFYARLVITSKVEALGFMTVIFGTLILGGFSLVSLKLAMILIFELLTVSLGAHAVARSAWNSGYKVTMIPPIQVTPEEKANG